MASYLWLRGGTWFFQLRPPKELQWVLGATPFRVRLPAQNRRQASRYARHLTGLAEQWMSVLRRYRAGARTMVLSARNAHGVEKDEDLLAIHKATRQRFQEGFLVEMERLKRLTEEFSTLDSLRAKASAVDRPAILESQRRLFEQSTSGWSTLAKLLVEDFDLLLSDLQNRIERAYQSDRFIMELNDAGVVYTNELQQKLDRITVEAANSEKEARSAHEANSRALSEVSAVMKNTAEITNRLLYQGPFLSEAMGEFLNAKRTQLASDSSEPAYFEHRLQAFLEIVGDKRISAYNEADLTLFAGRLQFLPERHTVDPDWRGKTLVQAIEENRGRSKSRRARSLSFTTIKVGYVGKIKTCIRWLCANHQVRYPFEYGHTLIPKDARTPTVRLGLDSSQLNTLFRACVEHADTKRPEDVWLPLLAFLTGARLSELVNLQPHNIKRRHDVDVVDLTTQISDAKGTRNRPIKTRESLRLFALHHSLRDLGFIRWVDSLREAGHAYLFPDLHAAKRPTHAASKRFQRLFARLDMGGALVFHSLRHSYKDWMRSRQVPERTITLQAGHSLDGIALRYGSKLLRSDELHALASVELPPGLNLEVFRGAMPRPTVAASAFRRNIEGGSLSGGEAEPGGLVDSALRVPKSARKTSKLEPEIDVRALRRSLRLSQREFAKMFEIPCGSVRDWEQGRSKPGRTARALLLAIQMGRVPAVSQGAAVSEHSKMIAVNGEDRQSSDIGKTG